MLHDLGATGAGIPIQALPMTHLISIRCVFRISSRSFSDFRILSSLQDTAYTHHLHIDRTSLRIYLYMNVHLLTASPRHPDATMTMQTTRQPNPIFFHGPETFSFAHEIDEMMKSSSCRSIARQ
jgi:hypothetical protein